MPTYVYETIPKKKGAKPQQFEIKQSIKDATLTHHPETGEAVRRVITAGSILIPGAAVASNTHVHSSGCCGSGCGR